MKTALNTFGFVRTLMQRFAEAQIALWLFGGWAEELQGLCSPRQHNDIDLLYPASNFHQLDQWLSTRGDLPLISAKRFSHKRAVLCEKVMIEMVLLKPQSEGYVTHFFDGKYSLVWPINTLSSLNVKEGVLPVASCQALHLYRQSHPLIAQAYQAHLQEHSTL